MNLLKKIRQYIATEIWDISEWLNIPLGIFAPIIFGYMIGSKGKKKS